MVQELTTALAMRPDFTECFAVMNISDPWTWLENFANRMVVSHIPRPKMAPSPIVSPYPTPWLKGGSGRLDIVMIDISAFGAGGIFL